jgi:hypothetical protein
LPPLLGFSTIVVLRDGVVSPMPNPQPGGPGLCIYNPQRQLPSYTPRHWVPILVASYDPYELRWGYSFSRPPHGKSLNITKAIKSRRMRWVEHVARMEYMINSKTIWPRNLKRKRTFGDL